MYPTKEGYTALLRRLKVKYVLSVSYDKGQHPNFAEIPVKIDAVDANGEKISFTVVATVKKDDYSSHDQLRGKAERRAKKALYEYITGCDFGDADEESSKTIDAKYEVVSESLDEVTRIDISERLETCQSLAGIKQMYDSLDESLKNNHLVLKMFSARKATINIANVTSSPQTETGSDELFNV